jgi:cation transport regulator ChaC
MFSPINSSTAAPPRLHPRDHAKHPANEPVYPVFSYGSNMDPQQTAARTPNAEPFTQAVIPGYELQFNKYSQPRQGSVLDIQENAASEVYGMVFLMPECNMNVLDQYENGYERVSCQVYPLSSNGKKRTNPVTVQVYKVKPDLIPTNPKPTSRDYVDTAVRGARYWGIPTQPILDAAQRVGYQA